MNEDSSRAFDEILKRSTNGKVNIEDINKRAEDKLNFITGLVKHTIVKIAESLDDDIRWGVAQGGPQPNLVEMNNRIGQELIAYIAQLTDLYMSLSNTAHDVNIKEMLDE